jgi:hypothetical protein
LKGGINMSITTETRFEVIEKAKELIMQKIDSGYEVSFEHAEKLVDEAAKIVAARQGKTVSTVNNQCSRELEVSIGEFRKLVVSAILGDSDALLEKMVTTCKSEMGDDNIPNIKSRMKQICG